MAASVRVVSVAELLSRMGAGRRLLGVSVTPLSVEVAVMGPPYDGASSIRTGRFLVPEELKAALGEAQADAVLLGGSAAFRTDGSTQLGVRKLISQLRGLHYDNDWLPSPAVAAAAARAGPGTAGAGGGGCGAAGAGSGASSGASSGAASVAGNGATAGEEELPIWYCRRGQDDPVRMLVEHVQAHTTPQQRLAIRSMMGGGAGAGHQR